MFKRLLLLVAMMGLIAGCSTAPKPEPVEQEEDQVESAVIQQEEKAPVEEMKEEAPEVVEAAKEPPVKVEEAAESEEPVAVAAVVAAAAAAPVAAAEPERTQTMILMKTSKGDITLELDAEAAPKTVANFLSYVEEGHFNGTIFHRVIDGFMIQGGGFDENMNQKPAPRTVQNEAKNGLKNDIGTIAMARTPNPHSASAQFFINVNNNAFLNYPGQDGWGYCVFGKVTEGMDVVNEIKGVRTGNAGGHQNVPVEPVMITEVTVIK